MWNTRTGAAALGALLCASVAVAADHQEAPGTKADPAADITDIYAWQTGTGTLVAVLNYNGLIPAGGSAVYDEDVLYSIHIDNDGDLIPDHDIRVRFGQNNAGEWGVQITDMPGADATVVGPVEATIDAGNGLRAYAGLRDDPFFFDLAGFQATLSTGTLSFDSSRDSFAGTNVTAIVLEMSATAASNGSNTVRIWATTARK